jgi:hypothetical protein
LNATTNPPAVARPSEAPPIRGAIIPQARRQTDPWFAETAALYLTATAIELVEEGRAGEASGIYGTLEPQNRQAFDDFLAMVDAPVSAWGEWLELCRVGSPVSFPEPDGPRPTAGPDFEPSADEEVEAAWLLNRDDSVRSNPNWLPSPADIASAKGWDAGMDGWELLAPAHYSPEERNAFVSGNLAGLQQSRAEAGLPAARWSGPDGVPFEELVEANGVTFARGFPG